MVSSCGCTILDNKFRYLGGYGGGCMTQSYGWDDVILKLQSRLSKWKAKTLSIGGRLTLLKSVLGASPLYNMSIFKVPKELLSFEKKGGLGGFRVISLLIERSSSYGFHMEFDFEGSSRVLKVIGFDFLVHIALYVSGMVYILVVGIGLGMGDIPLCELCPRLFALDSAPIFVWRLRWHGPWIRSFRRLVEEGLRTARILRFKFVFEFSVLSTSNDRWRFCIVFAVGGRLISSFGVRSQNGTRGFLLFVFRVQLKVFWKESSTLLGGLFGDFGIVPLFD
ncbi:hypothetical protein Tco_1253004, partial [Tanacetum coccineum]